MGYSVRAVEYFHATVQDRPGKAYDALSHLASSRVNLLAFSAVPSGGGRTQLVIYPDETDALMRFAARSGMVLSGPQRALLVQGDDELGALVEVHRRLADARVNVYASNGVTDGRGRYGYVVHVRSEDFSRAAHALGV